MTRSVTTTAFLVMALTSCATLHDTFFDSSVESRFRAADAAWERSDFTKASEDLRWIASRHADDDEGRRALLMLAAIELDPRNPQRRIQEGQALTSAYLERRGAGSWAQPVARTLNLMAEELYAVTQRIADAEATRDSALAEGPRERATTIPGRLRDLQEERDRLARRVTQLQQQLSASEKKLSDREKELERIRKTLKG